jgi:phage terminase large subunit-like protein
MGQRGLRAKPLKSQTPAEQKAARRGLAWAKRGLSLAAQVIAFCESLPVTKGILAGSKMLLLPAQVAFIQAVWGEGRAVRTAVLSMPRKSGKSGLAAALALAALSGPLAEPRGQVYSAANDRKQASIIFDEMVAIIEQVKYLSDRVNIRRFTKELEDFTNGSTYAALSADVPNKLGLSPSLVIMDELGAGKDRHLFDALDTSMAGRAKPLMLIISTQAPTDEHLLSELIDYGLACQRGEFVDPSFHLALYAAPEDADPWSPAVWAACNPALGLFQAREEVERHAAQARNMRGKEAVFRNLILNQRVQTAAHFIPFSEWKACNGKPRADLRGRPCWAGLDLSFTSDLSALVLVFPDDETGGIDILGRFYLPADNLAEKADEDRVPYLRWRDDGLLTVTPGASIDPAFIVADIARLGAEFDLRAVGL